MKYITETYEIQDVQEETIEQSAEALALIESLGLKGQKPKVITEEQRRCPYRLMTNEELFVFSNLCPTKYDVDAYQDPIPLEVLKTMAFAKQTQQFLKFEIWGAATSKTKDPVLVGLTKQWGGDTYILARWGEELLPLQVLVPDAIKVWYDRRQTALRKIAVEVKNLLECSAPSSIPDGRAEPVLYT